MEIILPLHIYEQQHKYKYQAVFHCIRDLITNGILQHGTPLPSSRDLASTYKLSRGTIRQVYDMLVADGYIRSEVGSGTYVSYSIEPTNQLNFSAAAPIATLSDWANEQLELSPVAENARAEIDFGINPFLKENIIPENEWMHSVKLGIANLSYTKHDPEGLEELRHSIAAYLNKTRGIACTANDIVILQTVMQALALLTKLFINPGDSVIIEDPTHNNIINAIKEAGGELQFVPIRKRGFIVDESLKSRLIFVTSNQFPTGKTMHIEQRIKLLKWAKSQGAIIVEADYESEFRRKGKPLEPIKVLDTEGRVIFLGTFSKTILRNIGVAFVVLPEGIRESFVKAKQFYAPLDTNLMEQATVAHYMHSGKYEKHLRKLNRMNKEKYSFFIKLFKCHLSDAFHIVDSDVGEHIFTFWKRSLEEYQLFQERCFERGVAWGNIEDHYVHTFSRPAIMFNYFHLEKQEMEEGIAIMSKTLKEIVT